MKLSDEEKRELEEIYQAFLHDEKILRMKEISMHRGSNCYIHSFKVAKTAIKRALRHNKGDLKTILLGAILHDYYLYDWRNDRSKMEHHLSAHPHIAAENAHTGSHGAENGIPWVRCARAPYSARHVRAASGAAPRESHILA